jgi:hypothetical protein
VLAPNGYAQHLEKKIPTKLGMLNSEPCFPVINRKAIRFSCEHAGFGEVLKSIFQSKFDLPVVYGGIGYGGATGDIYTDL